MVKTQAVLRDIGKIDIDINSERSSELTHRKGYKMCKAHLITFPYEEDQLKGFLLL